MTYATSSAEPSKLLRYSDVTTTLDSFLANAASPLRAALLHFEATCREPGFRMQVSHVSDWMVTYANQANSVDFWVRQIGLGFLHADSGALLQCIASWAWRAFQIAWNRFVDFAEDTWRKVQDAANRIVVKIGEAYTATANTLLASVGNFVQESLSLYTFATIYDVWMNPVAALPIVDSQLSIATSMFAPPAEPEGKPQHVVLPTNMRQLYAKIQDVDGENPIQVIKLREGEYLVLVKGTNGWYGASEIWGTNFTSGLGYESVYTQRLEQIIRSQIPEHATIHLAGHSQGGHAVQIVGSELAQEGKYAIGSLITFGAYYLGNTEANIPNRRHYLYENDALNIVDKTGIDEYFRPSSSGAELRHPETILHDAPTWNPFEAHTSYDRSGTLATVPVPFSVDPGQTAEGLNYDAPLEPPIVGALHESVAISVAGNEMANDYIGQQVESISQTVQSTLTIMSESSIKVVEIINSATTYTTDTTAEHATGAL